MKCELCQIRQATEPIMDRNVRRQIQYDFCADCAAAIRVSTDLQEHARVLVLLVAGTCSNRTSDRIQAIRSLGAHGEVARPTAPLLESLLADANPDVRAEAAAALEAIRGSAISNHTSEK